MKIENPEETFCTSWLTWEDAVLGYSTASGHKSVGLKHALRDWSHLKMTGFACSSDSEDDHGHGRHNILIKVCHVLHTYFLFRFTYQFENYDCYSLSRPFSDNQGEKEGER